jgi:sugar phosphate isomerase/epimerase
MPKLDKMEIGLMFWGEGAPERTIRQVKSIGFRCGHLGFSGRVPLAGAAAAWKRALDEQDFAATTVFAAYDGESYADIPTVQRTVGFIPPATRSAREKRTYEVIDTAAALGVPSFACHVGFVPHNRSNADYVAVRDLVRRICDHAAKFGMSFALETGQEPPEALLDFMRDTDRENLKVNFDPANLILYGVCDPIEALRKLAPHVVSVHCKDGVWPATDKPGALGVEMPLGEGAVGMARFIASLQEIGYTGPLTIEREVALDQDMDDRHKEGVSHLDDIRNAIKLLERLRSGHGATA